MHGGPTKREVNAEMVISGPTRGPLGFLGCGITVIDDLHFDSSEEANQRK